LSPEYLKISQGEEKPSSVEWRQFMLETGESTHGDGGSLLDEIRTKQLVKPGKVNLRYLLTIYKPSLQQ